MLDVNIDSLKPIEYDRYEIVEQLKEALKEIEEADDQGTIDHTLGYIQVYFARLEPILDENGGI